LRAGAARSVAEGPTEAGGYTMYSSFKRLVVGPPLSIREEESERLGKPTGLAVFASDAISSTAYATQQILGVLVPFAGLAALSYLVPISLVVVVLLGVVTLSYRQTVFAYPTGGGSYVVSRENLGVNAALVAGASLLVDYVLTVAVSVSAGVAAVIAAIPDLAPHRVSLCLIAIGGMMFANLRGLRASGKVFVGPTYAYVVMLALLLLAGAYGVFTGSLQAIHDPATEAARADLASTAAGGVTFIVLLRAFSSGAVALTGVEAISNGVPAFRKPAPNNAALTMLFMALILGGGFFGVSWLTDRLQPIPTDTQTVLSSMGGAVFGSSSVLFYLLQVSTFAILTLAANTSFADFPRVSSIMARDGYLPRQLMDRGDRLVYSNGIILLALVAGLLIVVFHGDTDLLVPLYAIGVFTAFTLSQTGMVVRHWKRRESGWPLRLAINAVGAVTTLVVLGVVAVSKFTYGAWIPLVLIPVLVLLFLRIHTHYQRVLDRLAIPDDYVVGRHSDTVVVLFDRMHRGVLDALTYARSLRPQRLECLAVVADESAADDVRREWARREAPGDLRVTVAPTHDLIEPVLALLDELDRDDPDEIVTIVMAEYVLSHWWAQMLHNQNVVMLRARLHLRPNTVVAAVPIFVGETPNPDVGIEPTTRPAPRPTRGASEPPPPRSAKANDIDTPPR